MVPLDQKLVAAAKHIAALKNCLRSQASIPLKDRAAKKGFAYGVKKKVAGDRDISERTTDENACRDELETERLRLETTMVE
jgi:hypothetical protein